ncbi:MAG: phosphoribosylglycinamide formyltransferase [Nanobdellota archaeon]
MELRLGFLASGTGSNVAAIVDAIEEGYLQATAQVVISNNSGAKVLDFARNRKIPHYCLNAKNTYNLDDALTHTLKTHDVNAVVLGGYMKPVSEPVIEAFPLMFNIHPALLPKYGGKGMYGHHVHQAVIESDDSVSGATVHLVNAEYDKGPILAQMMVAREKDDTAETLGARVLEVEHRLYYQTLEHVRRGLIDIKYLRW